MTTIVNTPPQQEKSSAPLIIGIIAILAFVAFLIYYGIPLINNMKPLEIQVQPPKVAVPDSIDVNVKQEK
jgi:flagellar biogenesis protein FliO